MKLNTVNVREMTCKNPKWDVLLGLPELRSSIIGTRDKVLAKRRKLHLPDWKAVTMEHIHEASFLQRPEPNYESNETEILYLLVQSCEHDRSHFSSIETLSP